MNRKALLVLGIPMPPRPEVPGYHTLPVREETYERPCRWCREPTTHDGRCYCGATARLDATFWRS